MHGYVNRSIEKRIIENLSFFPVAAILGPRQCGKSTLAKKILEKYQNAIYIDLESPEDLNKLQNPEYFFQHNKDKIICLDEIQRRPELFPVLKSVVDKDRKAGMFLILGPASP